MIILPYNEKGSKITLRTPIANALRPTLLLYFMRKEKDYAIDTNAR